MKNLLLIIYIVNFNVVLAQNNSNGQTIIKGEVISKTPINDSIFFNAGVIDNKYFESPLIVSKVINNKFNIKNTLSYPQMFRIVFSSDRNIRIWRFGKYFIDFSTKSINANYALEECNVLDGQTAIEYTNKFIPFFFKPNLYDCTSKNLQDFSQTVTTRYDSILLKYVIKNPNSYVALWSLIERFSLFGQTEIRQKTLDYFSNTIKRERIWNLLSNDIRKSRIKENKKFPSIELKNTSLELRKLSLPKAKYTLINYWFSRCRPCLDELPELKKLYSIYKAKGFEIVSISTDKTKDLSIWQKRIVENELNWLQYLDENGKEALTLSVNRFPSTFLLNGKGEVIKKDISPNDLELFLKEHF